MNRSQEKQIIRDLNKKLVFLVGPRQVGKTWLAKKIAKQFPRSVYLNYDRQEDREIIDEEAWLDDTDLLILDELHKKPQWKNYLKGVFDTKNKNLKILVTGSARMDTFRQSGDSLAGRFFLHHLFPFSLKECNSIHSKIDLAKLMTRSGFPEPMLAKTNKEADRWRMQYTDSLIRADVLDFENVHNLRALQLIFELLRKRVGAPVSYLSLARDVQVSPTTIKRYIEILEALYIIFRITPHSKNIARSLLKEPKIYFFDNGLVKGNDGIKFENIVANFLLKHTYGIRDYDGKNVGLHYIRTKEGKEVDFCLTEEEKLLKLIEAKYSESTIDTNLLYFSGKYKIPAIQVVCNLKRERKFGDIEIKGAKNFLRDLKY